MLDLKENMQNEEGEVNMCEAVDQMIAEGMERGISQCENKLILRMLKNGLSVEQIADITDKKVEEINSLKNMQSV